MKGVVVSILHTERVMKSADTGEGPVSMLAASCGQRWRLVIELQTKVSEDFTITMKASIQLYILGPSPGLKHLLALKDTMLNRHK